MTADCRYASDGTGLQRSVDPADGRVYTYTKFEPAYARRVFANFEQPDLKAVFTVHVTAPAHWTVLSNQPELEPAGEGDGAGVWHFPPTPLISTYLSALAAGEYLVVRASHTTPRGQAVPLALACRASLAGHLDADEVFGLTRQGLDFFTGLFGCDYPFAKYDQVFVPDYSVGATENVGCVVISDELLFRSRVTDTMRELRAMVILHEMAHMWFGDLVTMRWWDDLWLSEAFAEFCGTLASAEATCFSGAWSTFCSGRKAWGYMQDQLRYFEALPGIWAMRGEHIRVQLSQLLFPHPASSPRLLERIDAFLAAERPDPGLTRVLTEKRDIVARAMRSRALP